MYPEVCVQSIIGDSEWWIKDDSQELCRGALIRAFIPHVDQIPYTFEPMGRKDPESHEHADVKVTQVKVDQPLKQIDLPVAAMPLHPGELWGAYRSKGRPCLVLGSATKNVDKKLVRGVPNKSTAPTLLVAPYYGVDRDGKRAGYPPIFIERVQQCEYPQFLWDCLPISGAASSILRLDHLQPIGSHHNSYKHTGYRLSSDALEVVDELVNCLVWGGVEEDNLIAIYRSEVEDLIG